MHVVPTAWVKTIALSDLGAVIYHLMRLWTKIGKHSWNRRWQRSPATGTYRPGSAMRVRANMGNTQQRRPSTKADSALVRHSQCT